MTEVALPKDTFTTRRGKTIALKAWTFELIAEHADDIRRFMVVWLEILNGNAEADLEAIKSVRPALKASVQSEDSLASVEGLADMADLARAIWEYNEVGVGLGKFTRHQLEIQEGLTQAMESPAPPSLPSE